MDGNIGSQKNGASPFRLIPWLALSLLLVLPAVHAATADWQRSVGTAIFIALLIPVLIFAVGYLLHSQAFIALAREEVTQAVLTALLAGLLVSSALWFESNIKYGVATFSGAKDCVTGDKEYICQTINTAATGSLTQWALDVNALASKDLSDLLKSVKGYGDSVGTVSGRSQFCSLAGVGFSVAGCSAFGVLRGPLGQLMMAAGAGLMDLQAEQMLLNLTASGLTLNLLLPLGIVLRALHWTRKAGGIVLAIAISLYLVFPAILLVSQGMADSFVRRNSVGYGTQPSFPTPTCDPADPNEGELMRSIQTIRNGDGTNHPMDQISLVTSEATSTDKAIFLVFARSLLCTVLALGVTMGAVRVIGHLLAVEIDVTYIARLS